MPLKLDTYIITNADIVPGRDHIEGAREALQGGADVIQFRDKKKDIGVAKGVTVLREVSRAVQVPVVAIGGIDHGNATSCIEAGAAGCAVITAVIGAPDVRQAATNLAQIIRDAKMRVGKRRPT